jgi:hypothetical protein
MKKDAYYFPHYSNARNDAKLIKLRRVLGIEGYGLYFMLLEVLREQTDFQFPLNGIEDLSYEWHISKEKIISVIKDFDLFTINEWNFFSEKLILYLQPYVEKSERATLANKIRWDRVKKLSENIHLDIQMDSKTNPFQNPINKVNKVNKVNNISFDDFWNLYEKKVGDKTKLEAKWEKLTDEDRTNIMAYIPKYKESQPDKKYRKDPATFLNNKSWNDELIGYREPVKAKETNKNIYADEYGGLNENI